MFCPKCGNSLPDDAAFCGACGTQLASATPVQKPKVQVKKSWIAIGAAVLVVALVVRSSAAIRPRACWRSIWTA